MCPLSSPTCIEYVLNDPILLLLTDNFFLTAFRLLFWHVVIPFFLSHSICSVHCGNHSSSCDAFIACLAILSAAFLASDPDKPLYCPALMTELCIIPCNINLLAPVSMFRCVTSKEALFFFNNLLTLSIQQ